MLCSPCNLYNHLAFTFSGGPSSIAWSEVGPAPPFPPIRVLEVWWSHALNPVLWSRPYDGNLYLPLQAIIVLDNNRVIWTSQLKHSFLVGCLYPCLQGTSVRVVSPQPQLSMFSDDIVLDLDKTLVTTLPSIPSTFYWWAWETQTTLEGFTRVGFSSILPGH